MRMYFRVRSVDRYVGLFVLLALILTLVALIFIARGQKWFAKTSQYAAVFDKITQGVRPGTAVTISGVDVGTVESLKLNAQGDVEMVLGIYQNYRQHVRTDSMVTVSSTLLGAKTVEITEGSPGQPPMPPGGRLASMEPRELTDLLKGLDLQEPLRKVNQALENVNAATARLSSPRGELFSALRNVEFVTTQLKTGQGNLGALLQDRKIHQDLTATLASLRRTAAHLEETTRAASEASREFPLLVAKVDRTVQEVPRILEDVQARTALVLDEAQKAAADVPEITGRLKEAAWDVKAVTGHLREAAPEIVPLLAATREGVEEAQEFLEGLKKHWLLRGLFPLPAEKALEASPRESPYERERRGG